MVIGGEKETNLASTGSGRSFKGNDLAVQLHLLTTMQLSDHVEIRYELKEDRRGSLGGRNRIKVGSGGRMQASRTKKNGAKGRASK